MASLSIASLISFFAEEKKSIERGENHYKSDHIEAFTYHQGVLRGEVHASMKKKVYKVTIYLDDQFNIKSTDCECPRGKFKCSHAAALFIHGIHNLTRTDIECQWRKRKSTSSQSFLAVEEMFPAPKKYVAISRSPNSEDRSAFYQSLKEYGRFTGLCWLMSPEPSPQGKLPVPTIEEIIYSDEFVQTRGAQQQLDCLVRKAKITEANVLLISQITVGQRDNPAWHLARRGRLTASNFGSVLHAKRVTPSLLKRLLGEYDLSRVKAVQWGVNNEAEAVKAFINLTGKTVQETGLWLDGSGILGASPDGIVDEDSVLEAKCPYTERNMTIEDAVNTSPNFCLKKTENGQYALKEEHVYWHQVQGEIYFSRRKFCYFVVWTSKDVVVLKIAKDEAWSKNITKLTQFYFEHLFLKVVEGQL
ncbi:uncharacterized protein LOC122963280 [Acropora millepora]|uniref:uncharacterized protein LOC122963280 n=1 Tax=Acropora millepora TaxID=45264 RepID=UPI001CF4FB55|nr:uncharacterized protein LOC122963280 [Acropora millepora]